MSSKHLFDSTEGLVLKSLRGAVRCNPALRLHASSKAVYIASPSPKTKVAVISGGGAGHEPAHASYTGVGMLAASVSGDIFASPSAKQILNTIKFAAFAGGNDIAKDVLVVCNNYTGDRLNFGLAIEKARAEIPGIRVETVIVADDVSLLNVDGGTSLVGPRGLAGNILVCKILGALAEKGESLKVLKEFGDAVVANLASIGVGLDHCHVPGRQKGTSMLNEIECEIGLGLHNEPGVKKKELRGAEELIEEMIQLILTSKGETRGERFVEVFNNTADDVVLFVNNLGGMSQLEVGAIVDEIIDQLEKLNIIPCRIYVAAYMTSLNAPGFSISILNISAIARSYRSDMEIYSLLDASTEAVAWIGVRKWPNNRRRDLEREDREAELMLSDIASQWPTIDHRNTNRSWDEVGCSISAASIEGGIRLACKAVLRVEKELTEYDTILGDGDCGETMAAGAHEILRNLESKEFIVTEMSLSILLRRVSDIMENTMGGTIGALFGIFLSSLSAQVGDPLPKNWPDALNKTMEDLLKYTPAKPGDRTLIDALHPFCEALSQGKPIDDAARAAKSGAERTRGMRPRLGRAAYVATSEHGSEKLPPDPGAWAVAAILDGLSKGIAGGEELMEKIGIN
ncbi:Dak1 domain-containing protein [Crucibulum laeve]|uniref:Dak1 domain-containing protein n=1 Tax=Crucibulum laeve TaxID=68775 RepID=A0A5C3LSE9_9AGAR|nr:Dak1 domain-containing protein [Crucibulum laeve]